VFLPTQSCGKWKRADEGSNQDEEEVPPKKNATNSRVGALSEIKELQYSTQPLITNVKLLSEIVLFPCFCSRSGLQVKKMY